MTHHMGTSRAVLIRVDQCRAPWGVLGTPGRKHGSCLRSSRKSLLSVRTRRTDPARNFPLRGRLQRLVPPGRSLVPTGHDENEAPMDGRCRGALGRLRREERSGCRRVKAACEARVSPTILRRLSLNLSLRPRPPRSRRKPRRPRPLPPPRRSPRPPQPRRFPPRNARPSGRSNASSGSPAPPNRSPPV